MISTRWIPPAYVRASDELLSQYAREGRCECGAGLHQADGQIVLSSHHPNCQALQRLVAVEGAGYCGQCGVEKRRALRWDTSMQAAVRLLACPHGHLHDAAWIWPDDLTQAERDELGLIQVGEAQR